MKADETSDDYQFSLLLSQMRSEAAALKSELLNSNLNKLRSELGVPEYLKHLFVFYWGLALFPDNQIKQILINAGLKQESLQWFIPIEDIQLQINRIQASGKIKISKYFILRHIHYHLFFKILMQLPVNFDMITNHDGYNIPMVKKIFIDTFRRRSYGDGVPRSFKDENDLNLNSRIDGLEKGIIQTADHQKNLLKLSSGKTIDILTKIFQCFLKIGKLSEPEFCCQIYDFFRLIMRDDKTMFTEDEFLFNAGKSYRSYRIYQHKRIKDLFLI